MFNDEYNFHVDTLPMAEKMGEVSQQVRHTNEAVVVMESAVIASEHEAANKISSKLDVGFFNVVMSQIAQKVANERAQAAALAMELMQQQKALQNLQTRMSHDYNMISGRYGKLFASLNQELKNRVTELDKPLMEYCGQHVKALDNRIYRLVSDVPVYQSETLTASQAIAAAHIKTNAQHLIEAATSYITSDAHQRHTTKSLQTDTPQAAVYYVPVVVDEETTETSQGVVAMKNNPTLQQHLSERAYQDVVRGVTEATGQLQWHDDAAKQQHVQQLFNAMVENANIPRRMKEIMLKMSGIRFATL